MVVIGPACPRSLDTDQTDRRVNLLVVNIAFLASPLNFEVVKMLASQILKDSIKRR
jgi:hypothetical protein